MGLKPKSQKGPDSQRSKRCATQNQSQPTFFSSQQSRVYTLAWRARLEVVPLPDVLIPMVESWSN
jgi:hypothetical protein